ncbi:type II secretion system F family protein [Aestuariivita sp.]|jgi:tight adherence protein C|uniref:type II secretion system F family protein n=1 Tax=Aestuariivita sp. TaxID=1872407 RepID=UPI00216F219F|nr:type II secretion system F family protein [Aestuariivita sp.]MCE8005884.1 type II secretion system F family protein [Aestuariivita sp.]
MDFLTSIGDFLTQQLGPFGPLIVVGGLGLFMILLTIPFMLNQREDPLKKLSRANDANRTQPKQQERLRQAGRNEQLERFANFLEPKDVEELSAIQLKLTQAGYQSRDAVRMYHFAQFALGILGLVLGFVYVTFVAGDQEFTTQQTVMYTIGPGAAGYMLPKYWVTRRVGERQQQIEEAFPDALDMMLVCVEAGQSLDQSIIRVAKELRVSYPSLADEFEIVSYEVKAGKDRTSVLRDMATRCGVLDVSSFVTVMIQSQTFGTSIAEALRVYAGEMRDKRVMRAEEAANKLPTKMTLATMGLTVPPLLVILIGPSAHNISMMGTMGQ